MRFTSELSRHGALVRLAELTAPRLLLGIMTVLVLNVRGLLVHHSLTFVSYLALRCLRLAGVLPVTSVAT